MEYTRRLEALDVALRQHLPAAEYTRPVGGFFFWVRLPGVDAAELRPKAHKYKVDFRPGALFSSRQGLQDYVRLGFCYYAPTDLEEGVKRLSECLGEVA
jgi:2-aminoadipate transaminase